MSISRRELRSDIRELCQSIGVAKNLLMVGEHKRSTQLVNKASEQAEELRAKLWCREPIDRQHRD